MRPLEPVLAELNPKTSLLFGSGDEVLVTDGVFARIETPALGSERRDGALQRRIAAAFAEARAAGVADPIVLGSLPFDKAKPSCLVVPRHHRRVRMERGGLRGASSLPRATMPSCEAGRESFQSTVRDLLSLFRGGSVQKVVLSRALEVAFDDEVDVRTLLARLLEAHTTGYRFCVPVSDEETLIGASPELLVRRRGRALTSNPLAGSIARSSCEDEETAARCLVASTKDRHEHRLVIDEVRRVLARHCVELAVPETPSVLGTAALWHLSTVIHGVLAEDAPNALALASALHPTPAVCGHPCELARETIARVEPFDRGLFTGTTGWMDARGDGEWAVTIRCGVVGQRSVRVFAGAGIVEGSVPEQEWAETTAKLGPMLRTLGLSTAEASR